MYVNVIFAHRTGLSSCVPSFGISNDDSFKYFVLLRHRGDSQKETLIRKLS